MEQIKNQTPLNTPPPSIRVKVQTQQSSTEFESTGVDSYQAISAAEYFAQSQYKNTLEIEQLAHRNSALFVVCITLILASIAFAIGITVSRYSASIMEASPRHEKSY